MSLTFKRDAQQADWCCIHDVYMLYTEFNYTQVVSTEQEALIIQEAFHEGW